MKKGKSNTWIWIGVIAAIGGVATYLVIRNRKKKQVTPKATGLLVNTTNASAINSSDSSNANSAKPTKELLKSIRKQILSTIKKS